jgi:IS30 family transposase
MSADRGKNSRNAPTVEPWVREAASALLCIQWSPEQISSRLPISHETVYQHVYADKAKGGTLWKSLRCQKQKRKRYAGSRDRRGQIPNRRPLSERPLHIKARKQVGHWECDTVIGASHKGAVVTMVERKSGYAMMAKVEKKTSELVSSAIVDKLQPMAARVKTLTFDNGKEFAGHTPILINNFKARPTLPDHLQVGNGAAMKTSTACFANTFQRNEPCPKSATRKLG